MMSKKEEEKFLDTYEYDDSGECYEYPATQQMNAYELEEWESISPEIKRSIAQAMSNRVRHHAAIAALEEKKYEMLEELHDNMMKKYREDVAGLIEIVMKIHDIEGQSLHSLPKKFKKIKTNTCQRTIMEIKTNCEDFCGRL